MHQMILELLSHRTPPSAVSADVLTVTAITSPSFKVAKDVFSGSFICKCRSGLAYSTKLLADFQLARATEHLCHHSDGTKRSQIDIQNSILRIAWKSGYKNTILDSAIMSEDETAGLLIRQSSGRVRRTGTA